MIIRPCNIQLCDCPGADSPVTNLSSEAPDPLLFAGIGWTQYNPFTPPTLGNPPVDPGDCYNVSYSAISQAVADLLAASHARLCTPGTNPGSSPTDPTNPLPPNTPGGINPTFEQPPTTTVTPKDFEQFMNEAQTATVSCPNGAVFSYTVPAGTFFSAPIDPFLGPTMIEVLNAYALSVALSTVWSLRVCIEVPDMDQRRPPTIPPTPPPPPGSPPAGGPTLAGNPGYACFGNALVDSLNTYTVSSTQSFTFSISGNIPPGTSLVQTGPRSAVLSGTPSVPGNYAYTITAVQVGNPNVSVQVTDQLDVLGIFPASLPSADVGSPYGPEQLVALGGTPPASFSATGLPPGILISPTGIVSGTPTVAGNYSIVVTITTSD